MYHKVRDEDMLKLLKWLRMNIGLLCPKSLSFVLIKLLTNNLSVHVMLNIKYILAVETKTLSSYKYTRLFRHDLISCQKQ